MRGANEDIRNAISRNKLYQWEVADALNISEFTLSRWLRKELPEDKKALILGAIEQLKEEAI